MFPREFTDNKPLQAALAVLTFCYFIVFDGWIRASTVTVNALDNLYYTCPRYLQNCEWAYVLQALPHGYSQTVLYMGLFALLVWVVYVLCQKKWQEAQLLLMIPFFWHAAHVLIFTEQYTGNFEYYLIIFGVVLLFLPHKEFFLKLSIVWFYILSTVAKIHPAWIEGSYFTNLKTGLPIFPDWSIPIWTNALIWLEMVGAWFLMSQKPILQRTALVLFILFHLYSGILVEYRYPATVLPMLLVVFGPWYRYTPVPLDKKSVIGWVLILVLLVLQFSPRLIEGDEKLTLEANKYGLYMFESNHQCISIGKVQKTDGSWYEDVRIGVSARNRCDPYRYWFNFKKRCEIDAEIKAIAWTFDHSINGDPFLRIVDETNVCDLDYRALQHNDWIKTHNDNPPQVGWPVKNYYH